MKGRLFRKPQSILAYTIVEVMVAVSILTLGIVSVFKSFFICMDQSNHLTTRLYADMILDNHISSLERMLRAYKALPYDIDPYVEVDMGGKTIKFNQYVKIGKVEDFVDVFKVEVFLSWKEREREIVLSRTAYIADFNPKGGGSGT